MPWRTTLGQWNRTHPVKRAFGQAFHMFPTGSGDIEPLLSTTVTLVIYPCFGFPASLSEVPYSFALFPGITSQINYLYPNPWSESDGIEKKEHNNLEYFLITEGNIYLLVYRMYL